MGGVRYWKAMSRSAGASSNGHHPRRHVVSTLLDMALTPAVFYKFGGPAVEKFLKEEGKKLEKVEERDGHEEVMILPPIEKGEMV